MSSLPLWASGLIGTLVFFVLMFLKMHVGFALMIGGFVGYWMVDGAQPAFDNLAGTIFEAAHSHVLVIIPLFIVMGTIASASGTIGSAFNTFYKWLGRMRGGLAMAAVGSCAAFGAVCGDNIATAMTMDKAALPEMRKYGYKDSLAFGSIAAGGNLGLMIPPSAAFVVFGFITSTRITDLFIAGIIPGLILTVLFMFQIWFQTRIHPDLCEKGPYFTWKERFVSLLGIIAILIGFLLIMIGLIVAWFTPHEAGALGALVMTVLGLVYLVVNKFFKLPYPKLSWKSFFNAFMDATKTAAMILVLIFGARYFSSFLSSSNVAGSISDAVISSGLNRYLVLILVSVVLLILGCLMDVWSVMIITMPIFFDVLVYDLGFAPYQLGVIVVLCVMTGCITPPVGVVVFSLAGSHRETPMYTIFRGVLPFVLTMMLMLLLLIFVPQLSTWLPGFAQ